MPAPHDPVATLALWEPAFAEPGTTLREIAQQLQAAQIGAVLVRTEAGGVGVVSERDIVAALADGADPDSAWGDEVMTTTVRIAHPHDPIVHVALEMLDAGVRHIVVTEEAKAVGVVSMRDVLRPLVDDTLTQRPTGQLLR